MCDKARYQSSEEESLVAAVDAANDDTFVLQEHFVQQQQQQQQQQQYRHQSQNGEMHSLAGGSMFRKWLTPLLYHSCMTSELFFFSNYSGGGDYFDVGDPTVDVPPELLRGADVPRPEGTCCYDGRCYSVAVIHDDTVHCIIVNNVVCCSVIVILI